MVTPAKAYTMPKLLYEKSDDATRPSPAWLMPSQTAARWPTRLTARRRSAPTISDASQLAAASGKNWTSVTTPAVNRGPAWVGKVELIRFKVIEHDHSNQPKAIERNVVGQKCLAAG